MDVFNSNYWKLVRTLQQIIGFWHFHSKWKKLISWSYVYIFTLSFMISMGIRLYNEIGVNQDIVVENIVGEAYLAIVFFKLTLNIFDAKELKHLYRQIAKDWQVIVDEEELKVMHKYMEAGRKRVTLYSGYMIVGVSAFLTMPIIAPLLDYIVPLENATRPKALPYYAEYGVDQENYYYPLISQAVFGGVGTITVFVTFDLGFIMIVQHVVALFALVNFRLQKVEKISEAMEKGVEDCNKGDMRAYENVTSAIELHQIVIEYVNLVEDCYSKAWLVINFLNIVMVGGGFSIVIMFLSFFVKGVVKKNLIYNIGKFRFNFITFIMIKVVLMKLNRPEELFRYVVVLNAELIHFYFIFLPGQKIINSSTDVFEACYACKWYNLSEKTKNLLKVMMIRSLRRCELTGGKMFILSMDTYCSMMKTGLSLFTVVNAQN